MRLGSLAVLLGGALALDCGGKGAAQPDSGTPVDSGTPADQQGDGIPGVTGLVASNGVPIPDPQPGAQCLRDADCGSACVANADGSRSCSDGLSGSGCNRHEQCGDGKCVLADGAFLGVCTNGTNGAPCLAAAQCVPGSACSAVLPKPGLCSNRGKGAPCSSDGDCNQGFCVQGPSGVPGACDTGEPGAACKDTSDCRVPFCYRETCSAGANGDACRADAECATKMCASAGANAVPGKCTDGKLGSACWGSDSKQCEAGLHCTSALPGTCIASGGVGDACQQDADCQNGKCGGTPNGPAGLAVCTEGKLGQRCRDTAQCGAGLHCVSNGFAGACVAGAGGDPCAAASDCMSGTCLGDGLMPGITCPMELGRCGEQGACVAGSCFSICAEP